MFFRKDKNAPRARLQSRARQTPVASREPVYSYRASRSMREDALGRITPDQAVKTAALKRRLRWLRHTPNIALLCAAVLLVLYGLHLSPRVKVVPTDTKNQVFLRGLQTYEDGASRAFSASFTNNNKLTVNTTAIAGKLTAEFPELKTAVISLPLFGDQPVVYIQPAMPALVLRTAHSGTFIVATSGKALIAGSQVPNLSKLKLPTVTDQSGLSVRVGEIALSGNTVSFIVNVAGQLQAKGLTLSSLTLPQDVGELDVQVSGVPYVVKFNLQGDGRAEAGAYLAAKLQLEAQHKKPAQYVDVRVQNRLYFK